MRRILCLLLCMVLLLSGCGLFGGPALLTDQLEARPVSETIPISDDYTEVLPAFSAELFAAVQARDEFNPVLSPLSVYLALAMAAQGAGGETGEAFAQVLGLSANELNIVCHRLLQQLEAVGGSTTLHVASSVWMTDSAEIKSGFLQDVVSYYGADIFQMDLQHRDAPAAVNEWVSGQTEGRIPAMLDSVGTDARMLLMNTLYLDARWMRRFDPINTRGQEFYTPTGAPVFTLFLWEGARTQQYFQDDVAEGVVLRYDDGQLAFVAIKPKSADLPVTDLPWDAGTLRRYLDRAAGRDNVILTMPKFHVEYGVTLNDALEAMGLEAAFDGQVADFGRISDGGLFIDQVVHRVSIRFDEEGTEAAAASSVEMAPGSAPADEPYLLTFDHPFLYAIVELDTGIPLFLGRLDVPTIRF